MATRGDYRHIPFVELPWTDRALCRLYPTAMFFGSDVHEVSEAKHICRRCPVLEPCREYAIPNEEWGTWGAMSERERREIRKRRRRNQEFAS